MLKIQTEEMVEREKPAAVHQHIERGDRPHQRIFEAKLVPKVAADAPALDIGDQQEQKHREGEQWTADELGHRNRRRPKSSWPVTATVQTGRQLLEIERERTGVGKKAERITQAVRYQRQPNRDAQQRVGEWRQRLIEPGQVQDQCAINTGSLALARMCRVVPPKIIWRNRLCV